MKRFIRSVEDKTNIGNDPGQARFYRRNIQKAYKEGFEEFKKESIQIIIFGKNIKIHSNVNFYVDLTYRCNGNCKFCIAKTLYDRSEEIDVKEFEFVIDEVLPEMKRTVDPTIQITGGEPGLVPEKLAVLLKKVKALEFKRPVLNTNGQTLVECLAEINSSTLQWINISRHHYDDEANEACFGGRVPNNKTLSDIWFKLQNECRVRMQCNLLSDFIDNWKAIKKYICKYEESGIRNFVFAVLTPLPRNDYYQKNIIDYVSKHLVNALPIIEEAENDGAILIKYRGGVACYYEVFQYSQSTVLFKLSDNTWLKKADQSSYYPDFVLHTNGSLCGSWNRELKILRRTSPTSKKAGVGRNENP